MKTFSIKLLTLLTAFLLVCSCEKEEEGTLTGNLVGKVIDFVTGEVLQDAMVTIIPGGLSRTTGSDGYFEFLDLEPKQYEIQAMRPGYVTNNKTVLVVAGQDRVGDIRLSPVEEKGKLALSVSYLNFGPSSNSLSFEILNIGNRPFNWNISGLDKVDWLSVLPASGTVEAGKSNVVVVSLNRDVIKEAKETVILVNADNESAALKISAEVEVVSRKSKIELSTDKLDFGSETTSMSLEVTNVGEVDVNWTVSDVNTNWVKVTPVSGSLKVGNKSTLQVVIERSELMEGENKTTFFVRTEGESLPVTVQAVRPEGEVFYMVATGIYTHGLDVIGGYGEIVFDYEYRTNLYRGVYDKNHFILAPWLNNCELHLYLNPDTNELTIPQCTTGVETLYGDMHAMDVVSFTDGDVYSPSYCNTRTFKMDLSIAYFVREGYFGFNEEKFTPTEIYETSKKHYSRSNQLRSDFKFVEFHKVSSHFKLK